MLAFHHPNPESQGDDVTTLSHTSPTYQAGYQQQMLVNPYQDDPYGNVGRMPATSLPSSQGRPSPLQPFLVAESQGDTHSAYGKHLKVATPLGHQDPRFQASPSLQYHGPYNDLHSTLTQSPTVPQLESPPNSNESQNSDWSSEGSPNPYYGISQKRGLVSPNDPEVIQAAAALEKVLFGDEGDVKQPNKNRGDEGDVKQPNKNRGDAAQTAHRSKPVKPKHKLANPNPTGHGQTLPDEMDSRLQDQKTSMKGPQSKQEISNQNTAAVSHSRSVSVTERNVSKEKKKSVQARTSVEVVHLQVQNTPPFQEINSQEVSASLSPHSGRGSASLHSGRASASPHSRRGSGSLSPHSGRASASPHSGRGSDSLSPHSGRGSDSLHSGRGSGSLSHSGRASASPHSGRGSGSLSHSRRGSDSLHSGRGSASLPHSGRGSANVLEPLKRPVQTTVAPVAMRRSTSPVRVEKKATRRTETHPAHFKSRKIFDRKESESTGHSRRLTSDVHPTINVPTSQNVDQQVQNSTTHNIPLPPIGGSSGDESSSQNQAETSSSPSHRLSTGKGTRTSSVWNDELACEINL